MIGSVQIQNYKSIRDLKFDAKRVNVFIGEPNTGKSNIVEALAFFSAGASKASSEILRFGTTSGLFYCFNGELCYANKASLRGRTFKDPGLWPGCFSEPGQSG